MTAGLYASAAITHAGTSDGEPVHREGRLGAHRRGQVRDEARAEFLLHLGEVASNDSSPSSSAP